MVQTYLIRLVDSVTSMMVITELWEEICAMILPPATTVLLWIYNKNDL